MEENVALKCRVQLQLKLQGNQRRNNHRNVAHPMLKARINKGLTVSDICRLSGLSYDNYMKYEKEMVDPQYMSLKTLETLSRILGINLITDYHIFKSNSSQLVREYMAKNNLSNRKAAIFFKVSTNTIKNWLSGKCSPSYNMWNLYFKKK